MKMNARVEAMNNKTTKTPVELISSHNLNKIAGVCRRYGCVEVPKELSELVLRDAEENLKKAKEAFEVSNPGKEWNPEDSIQELKASKAVAALAVNFENTLKGGDEVRVGAYALRLSTVHDTYKGGRILVVTAPELADGILAEYAKKQQEYEASRKKEEEERASQHAKTEEAKRRNVDKGRENRLVDLGIQPSEEMRNFLATLPLRVSSCSFEGSREYLRRIVKSNSPDDVKIYGDINNSDFFAVTINQGGKLRMTIFAKGIDYITPAIKRLSMTAEEAEEIQIRKNLMKVPATFNTPVPEEILRKIVEELPHDRKYVPYFHVYGWKEAFTFAENAVKVLQARQGESVNLLLQGTSKVKFVKIKNYYANGATASGVVPEDFDDEKPCAIEKNGVITIYLPDKKS